MHAWLDHPNSKNMCKQCASILDHIFVRSTICIRKVISIFFLFEWNVQSVILVIIPHLLSIKNYQSLFLILPQHTNELLLPSEKYSELNRLNSYFYRTQNSTDFDHNYQTTASLIILRRNCKVNINITVKQKVSHPCN